MTGKEVKPDRVSWGSEIATGLINEREDAPSNPSDATAAELDRLKAAFPKAVSNAIGHGMIIAAAMVAPCDPVIAEQIVHESGWLTAQDMKKGGVADFDIRKLKPVLKNIAERAAK